MRTLLFLLICLACQSPVSTFAQRQFSPQQPCNPLKAEAGADHDFSLTISDEKISRRYGPVFQKEGIPYTTETWVIILEQLLRKQAPELRNKVVVEEEEGRVLLDVPDAQMPRFFEVLCPVFTDARRLAELIKSIDRSELID